MAAPTSSRLKLGLALGSVLLLPLSVYGLASMGSGSPPPPPPAHARIIDAPPEVVRIVRTPAGEPGPEPDHVLVKAMVRQYLQRVANDPASVQNLETFREERSKVGAVVCWKVPVRYRAKNGFGALVLSGGSVWVKDGKILKDKWD